jgi:hypothetical protein
MTQPREEPTVLRRDGKTFSGILITGKTSPHDAVLRRAGAIWDASKVGYVARAGNDKARSVAEAAGLDIIELEATEEDMVPVTGDGPPAVPQAKAEWGRPEQVKGDAESRRQARRDSADASISLGDLIDTYQYGPAVVIKINVKSYTVRLKWTGRVMTQDKSYCTLIERREPVAPKFRKGDKVVVRHLAREYSGEIMRRTSEGYAVRYSMGISRFDEEPQFLTESFSEKAIRPA